MGDGVAGDTLRPLTLCGSARIAAGESLAIAATPTASFAVAISRHFLPSRSETASTSGYVSRGLVGIECKQAIREAGTPYTEVPQRSARLSRAWASKRARSQLDAEAQLRGFGSGRVSHSSSAGCVEAVFGQRLLERATRTACALSGRSQASRCRAQTVAPPGERVRERRQVEQGVDQGKSNVEDLP